MSIFHKETMIRSALSWRYNL